MNSSHLSEPANPPLSPGSQPLPLKEPPFTPLSSPLSFEAYASCRLCPRSCGADRRFAPGFCGLGDRLKAARAALHHWEEPALSGPEKGAGGSGTIFFSGCTLRCCFCQNRILSAENFGKELTVPKLAQVFLKLQSQGAYNINLVTATQFLPHILGALDQVRHKLTIPVVYNCGGYERTETVKALKDYVDIWLPDFKYHDNRLGLRYSHVDNYFDIASEAILQMIGQTGAPRWESQDQTVPLLVSGVIIRHLVLPSHKDDSIALLRWMKESLPEGRFLLSLMSQYTPYYENKDFPELNRRITTYEYNQVIDEAVRLGLTQGFMQQKSSAKEEYTPPFNLKGL